MPPPLQGQPVQLGDTGEAFYMYTANLRPAQFTALQMGKSPLVTHHTTALSRIQDLLLIPEEVLGGPY